ncbi:MAG: PTS sugar transporter subunit IIB [Desulfuromonas sp.]|nr:PTS sugar transporter subunit IIB [Desulfuromonas sp.]
MAIVLARVDNRLVHGQVLESWVPYVQADYIVVVDDAVAEDPFRRQLMLAVIPSTLDAQICSHADVQQLCQSGLIDQHNVLLLFSSPEDALRAYQEGLLFSKLNLGNMHAEEGKRCVSRTLSFGSDDVVTLERLARLGVVISAQCIPTDRALCWDCQCEELRG